MSVHEYIQDALALIGALAALYAVVRVRELHVLVNSRLTELLKLTQSSSYAEGRKAERDQAERGES